MTSTAEKPSGEDGVYLSLVNLYFTICILNKCKLASMLKPTVQCITVYYAFNIDWVSITFSEHFSESITLEKGDENVRIHIEKII